MYTMQEFKDRIAPRFPALSTIGVLGIVFVAMALKAQTLVDNPGLLLVIFIPLLLLYLLNFCVFNPDSKVVFYAKRWDRFSIRNCYE
jgi:ACR3 family arsenite efflux pump ArsB